PPPIYPPSLHDALPISPAFFGDPGDHVAVTPLLRVEMLAAIPHSQIADDRIERDVLALRFAVAAPVPALAEAALVTIPSPLRRGDRKSTRLNSSHVKIS